MNGNETATSEGNLPQVINTHVQPFAGVPERQQQFAVVPENSSAAIMGIIVQTASDPQTDVGKMQRLLEMYERLAAKDAEREFNRDFAQALLEMPKVFKRGIKDMGAKGKTRHELYEDLDAAIRPIEAKYGFARSFSTRVADKPGVILVLTLSHRAGHSITSERYCPPDPGPGRNDTQAIGSGESYGRRYLTKSVWNIVTVGEDDDGNSAENLSDEKYGKLQNMIEACGLSGEEMNRLLKYLGVNRIEDVREGGYEKAIKALSAKLRQKQGVR